MESINKMMAVIAAVTMVAVCLVTVAAPADAEGTATEVTDEQGLRSAIADEAAVINITEDFTIESYISIGYAVTINGNGCTLTASAGWTPTSGDSTTKYMLTFTKDSAVNNLNLNCNDVAQGINVFECKTTLNEVSIDNTIVGKILIFNVPLSSINVNSGSVEVTGKLTTDHGVELTTKSGRPTATFTADNIEGVGPVYQARESEDTTITTEHSVEADLSASGSTIRNAYFSNADEALAFYNEFKQEVSGAKADVTIVADDSLGGTVALPSGCTFTIAPEVKFVFEEGSDFTAEEGSTFTNNGNTEFRGNFKGTIVNNGTATVYPTSNVTEENFSEDSTGTPVFEDDEETDEPDIPVNPPVEDEDTLPFPPVASQSGSDDDVTVVACAAAAVVAALMAAFLILGSKKD